MVQNEWRRRIARAEKLAAEYGFASEILRFYAAILRFQEKFSAELEQSMASAGSGDAVDPEPFARPLPQTLDQRFDFLLSVVEQHGPEPLQKSARELRDGGADRYLRMLSVFWSGDESESLHTGHNNFFVRAFLQPYAERIRLQSNLRWTGPTPFLCPFCKRKPSVGVLRPLGDGGQRSLVCSFCLAEWEFRRIVCPGCGEEDHAKLPVYTAEELQHVRVEACDSCKTYIKTVDMTTNGLAEPIVDEMTAIPLDLWAQKQGYRRLQSNLLQL